MNDKVLEAEGIAHSYGDLDVIEDLSLSLGSGATYALVGANGSGKTTLLKILAGLIPPDTGVVETHAEAARTVGYLPQQPSFRDGFTVTETLRFYTRLLDVETDAGYVEDALESVGLSNASDRGVAGLSGGMTRLLGVAQAQVGDPPIMMLDEPTSGLDPEMTGRIFDILDGLTDEGAAVLLTTHDLERVAGYADEIIVVHDGGIADSGSPDELTEEHGVDSLTGVFDAIVRGGRS